MQTLHWFSKIRHSISGELFYVSVIFGSGPLGFECAGLNSMCIEATVLYPLFEERV